MTEITEPNHSKLVLVINTACVMISSAILIAHVFNGRACHCKRVRNQ